MSTNLAVEKHISVYVVRVNSDLTEGKGRQVIKAVCAIRSTAVRLARGADVQGSNGQVTEESAFWLATLGLYQVPSRSPLRRTQERKTSSAKLM